MSHVLAVFCDRAELLLWRDGWRCLDRRCVGALVRYVASENSGQLFPVVSEELPVMPTLRRDNNSRFHPSETRSTLFTNFRDSTLVWREDISFFACRRMRVHVILPRRGTTANRLSKGDIAAKGPEPCLVVLVLRNQPRSGPSFQSGFSSFLGG
jgi:hypothetical protein